MMQQHAELKHMFSEQQCETQPREEQLCMIHQHAEQLDAGQLRESRPQVVQQRLLQSYVQQLSEEQLHTTQLAMQQQVRTQQQMDNEQCMQQQCMQQSYAAITPKSSAVPSEVSQPAMGPEHWSALQQPAMSPPTSLQPASEDDAQLRRVVEELHASPHAQRRRSAAVLEEVHANTQPRHPGAGQRTPRDSPFPVDGPLESAVPPPRAEGQADGAEDAPSSMSSSPAKGGSPRAGSIQGSYTTFYPCIDGLFFFTGWVFTAFDFSITGLHLAAASAHGASRRCSADGEADWEVRSCGGWGGGYG
jgi:hypothetical protein